MSNQLIATTRAGEVQPLAIQGQLVVENWAALRLVLGTLGAPFEALLAEPVIDSIRGEIDWYAEPADTPAEHSFLLDRFREMTIRCTALAVQLETAAAPADRVLGAILRLALVIPDESFVRTGKSGPVLVGWGHKAAGPGAERIELSGRLAVPAAPAVLPPPLETLPATAAAPPPEPFTPSSAPPPPPLVEDRRWRDWRAVFAAIVQWGWLVLLAGLLIAIAIFGPPYVASWAGDNCRSWPLATLALLTLLLCLLAASLRPGRALVWLQGRADVVRAHRLGLATGTMQIVLAWGDVNDLDLHVVCPDGGHISFERPRCSGGRLDLDANARRPEAPSFTRTPMEHVVWIAPPPPGRYDVYVDPYEMRARKQSEFRVTVRLRGRTLASVRGRAQQGRRMQRACHFTVGG